ncbi:sterile alpha and TIR motif-containing protein 1-like [Protobothrops mucrosquamatus]|uniref:sterile alpha and TIR motif-containing protein 1-like n=1 Tax=Protobothrops mucrosquamatus TaxID=103944 RepID=UPI0010FAE212|nr:sterile alpha and TIR motif-containing protein 1-like [Protobothrops mucrosquamatus]
MASSSRAFGFWLGRPASPPTKALFAQLGPSSFGGSKHSWCAPPPHQPPAPPDSYSSLGTVFHQLNIQGLGADGPDLPPGLGSAVQAALERSLPELHQAVSAAKQAAGPGDLQARLGALLALVGEAWRLPAVGREVAKGLCDALRLEGGLDLLLDLLRSAEPESRSRAAQLLEQVLVAENRNRVARIGLGVVLSLAKERESLPLARSTSGILEHMFKHSEETSLQLIAHGGLDAVLFWCRWSDPVVLRHCAAALANCAMYGGQANQRRMVEKKASEWLFPLAFSKEDEMVQFQACLAIAVLATNKEIEKEVENSGTLALVEPFVATLDPVRFAHSWLGSSDNSQGRTADDLQCLVPLLDSSRLEAQCIAAFYLCVEAAIKAQQKKTKIFAEIGAIQSLKRVVCYSANGTTSMLAKRALSTMGEEVPRRLLPTVPNWKTPEVQKWLQQIGFVKYFNPHIILLKVHLQLHGFSVFLDVEKLEAGKFEDKLTQSVMSARNFVLVLSVQALDRCKGDVASRDWVHKEIATALSCRKNVIPVTDHFEWPDPEELPEDMRL